MKTIRELFSDPSGGLSLMRVMSFLVLCQAFVYIDVRLFTNGPIDTSLVGALLGIAMAGKAAQRFAENPAAASTAPKESAE